MAPRPPSVALPLPLGIVVFMTYCVRRSSAGSHWLSLNQRLLQFQSIILLCLVKTLFLYVKY